MIEIFKVLGDETRVRIFNLLRKQDLCVCELETILEITQSNASRHLNRLKNAGLITYEKKAQWVYYKLDQEFIEKNRLLYNYLNDQLDRQSQWQKDMDRLKRYKSSNLTCEDLRSNHKIVF